MYVNNLEKIVFERHIENQADELQIITGYVGPYPFSKLRDLPIDCSVVYGMYGSDRIGNKLHDFLNHINQSSDNINLLYSTIPVHAKCYIWKKQNKIVDALIGSANFTRMGLATPNREILIKPNDNTYTDLDLYYKSILEESIDCSSTEVKTRDFNELIKRLENLDINSSDKGCSLSLLSRGKVPKASGLNWGMNSTQIGGKAHTCIGDAEIRVTKDVAKQNSDLFFPKPDRPSQNLGKGKSTRQNDAIEIIWDDGTIMEGLMEQNMIIDSLLYPKAICSSNTKAELGLYLRNRIGVSDRHPITIDDLNDYGRTDITIISQAEGVYYMDFSVK